MSSYRVRRLRGSIRRRLIKIDPHLSESYYLDGRTTSPRSGVHRLSRYSPAAELSFRYPGDDALTTMSFLPRYTYSLEDVTLDPLTGLVYDSSGQLVAESSAWPLLNQRVSWPKPRLAQRRLPSLLRNGSPVFLSGGRFSGFYHWLLEDLPVALRSIEVADNPVVIVPSLRHRFVDDVLEFLDLPYLVLPRSIRLPYLTMTGKVAGLGSPWGVPSPHPADVQQLRRSFSPVLRSARPTTRLVISRRGYRRAAVEEEVFLQHLEKAGFDVIDPANLGLIEQMRIFSSAAIVTGFHGAAHSNCVWMSPRLRVEELLPRSYTTGYFSALASCLKLSYRGHIYDGKGWQIGEGDLMAAVQSAVNFSPPTP